MRLERPAVAISYPVHTVCVHASEISFDKTLGNDDRIVLRDTISDEYFLDEASSLGSADTVHLLLFGGHASGGGRT
jgi:hypothetical protein